MERLDPFSQPYPLGSSLSSRHLPVPCPKPSVSEPIALLFSDLFLDLTVCSDVWHFITAIAYSAFLLLKSVMCVWPGRDVQCVVMTFDLLLGIQQPYCSLHCGKESCRSYYMCHSDWLKYPPPCICGHSCMLSHITQGEAIPMVITSEP